MSTETAIVVACYNRPAPLWRLLSSLANAHYSTSNIPLVISIDKSDSREVAVVAENFNWLHGEKIIIEHPDHLGLKEHVLRCGDLTKQYQSVIILEDDLLVSPWFYEYALKAKHFYHQHTAIAGISLYAYEVAESCFFPFKAIDDGSDVYFMQVASSWGQLWTKEHWLQFKNWFEKHPVLDVDVKLPNYLFEWGKHSWKKHFIHYLIDTNRYFVFPRLSLTTNFEEPGTNASTRGVFQVPVQVVKKEHVFVHFEQSGAVYDAWFEISNACLNKLNSVLEKFTYTVNLYGSKQLNTIDKPYVLTIGEQRNAQHTFSSKLFPLENNVALNVKGSGIALVSVKDYVLKKPGLRNLLEERNKQGEPSISIIVPFISGIAEDLKQTLLSIEKQNYALTEVIVIAAPVRRDEVERYLSCHSFNYRYLSCTANNPDAFVALGLEQAKNKIVSWVLPGNTFSSNCFANVSNILRRHNSLSWIRGVDLDDQSPESLYMVPTFKYRLVPGEAYKRLMKHSLDVSTEFHFFYKDHLAGVLNSNLSLPGLFLHLLLHYDLRLVVFSFGHKRLKQNNILAHPSDEEFVNKLAPYRFKTNLKSKIIQLLLRSPLFNDGSWQWYYTSLHHFPDVLRFDAENNNFYYCKF